MRHTWPVTLVLPILAGACASPRPTGTPASLAVVPSTGPSPAGVPRVSFEASVKPILVSSCMPCHFPGGKMYGSMPFDDPATVASHYEGIARRIKDAEKRKALEDWRATP